MKNPNKFPKKYFEQFGCVIGDEAHLFKAKSLTSILTKLHLCKYRFGLTGTLDGMQTHRLVLEGLFGTLNKVITTKELIDKKTLAEFNIRCLVLTYPEEECKLVKDMKYQEEMEFIVTHPKRNEFIRDLVLNLKGNTLVLFQFVEKHGNVLYDLINKATDRKVFYVYGGTDTETREEMGVGMSFHGFGDLGVKLLDHPAVLLNLIGQKLDGHRCRRDQRIVDRNGVARAHEHLDNVHFAEVADIGNRDLFDYTVHGGGASASISYFWIASSTWSMCCS